MARLFVVSSCIDGLGSFGLSVFGSLFFGSMFFGSMFFGSLFFVLVLCSCSLVFGAMSD